MPAAWPRPRPPVLLLLALVLAAAGCSDSTVREMARLGLLLVHGGVWSGERILGEDWVYEMTHPAFEDANTAYGYLTWLNTLSAGGDRSIECAPLAVNFAFPHGLSEAPDCGYATPASCTQEADVGVWYAAGLFGQYILGHRALDLVLVVKDFDPVGGPNDLWEIFRPALIARDPEFAGDESAFCAAYAGGGYAPDLR
jgi:CubicO group peptidase (beta-lactamase class C family)